MRLRAEACLALAAASLTAASAASGQVTPAAPPVTTERAAATAPYELGGRTYTPVDTLDYDEVGYAIVATEGRRGATTANGEPFRSAAIGASHRTLPLPSYVEVTRLDTGRTVLVRIEDRGPTDARALIGITPGAAAQLGRSDQAPLAVRVRRTFPVEAERAALTDGRSVQARVDTPESLLVILRERAQAMPRPGTGGAAPDRTPAVVTAAQSSPVQATPVGRGWFVQVGAFRDPASARRVAGTVGGDVSVAGSVHRVRVGPFGTRGEAEAARRRIHRDGVRAIIVRGP